MGVPYPVHLAPAQTSYTPMRESRDEIEIVFLVVAEEFVNAAVYLAVNAADLENTAVVEHVEGVGGPAAGT